MPDTVIILAGGKSSRWDGTIKYLLPVCGEPVLHRTVRLVREILPHADVHVIGEDIQRENPNEVIAITSYLWGENGTTFILLGDVSWMKGTLRHVLTTPTTFSIYGRAGPNPLTHRPYSEIFAFAFTPLIKNWMKTMHEDSVKFNPRGDWWDVARCSDLSLRCLMVYDCLRLVAGFRGVYWYGLRKLGRTTEHPRFVDVGEGITDDFDEPEWYQPYLDAVEPGRLIDREVPP